MRKTKIVCTMGPATEDDKVLRELMRSGMAVARFNFSHGDHEMHKKTLERVVRLREELDLPIATMLDTKGPEIRLGSFKNGKVLLKKGTAFTLRLAYGRRRNTGLYQLSGSCGRRAGGLYHFARRWAH